MVFCRFVILIQKVLLNTAGQAGRGGDQAFVMLAEHFCIHSGFAVKAMHEGFRNQKA